MHFTVLPARTRPPKGATSHAFLVTDNWDDWGQYSTQYYLIYCDANGAVHDVGQVKIAQFGMQPPQRRPSLAENFPQLGENYFSLGQDDSYYERLNTLGEEIRDEILRSLRDVALDEQRFDRARNEHVTGTSLLRFVPPATVTGQFRRLARGGARLSQYHFKYTAPNATRSIKHTVSLSFDVKPESEPPTNIHVLIGRNGVGKTYLLNHMARALADENANPDEVGSLDMGADDGNVFANLVSVTFSAFDPFEPFSNSRNKAEGVHYTYIGLKRIKSRADGMPQPPKDPSSIAREFSLSVKVCLQGARLVRWRRALETLETDPIFSDARVADLADSAAEDDELKNRATRLFRQLSSGHKIVLLTITRLVESVEERSLVLLDEPEAHLHPPLLGAFIRALSDLLVDRNGVAIIATHSPVVLQEVPRNCVWKLRRSGRDLVRERPEIETFGENVGVLTREIFGLEVTQSGFHRLIGEAVRGQTTYEEIIDRFSSQLGGEAKAIIRGLIATRDTEADI
ncbi:AAA family ATPase [Planotetraspora mira]|uniref:AAA+ ATPase domain-containing protein n=1 Tax=Planotetraspora mira TaxID=58121 RepID=A0A8J3U7R7_9ACTN|nr:AAA family ATPase [Planotetraspora mira]GII34140.1 hypothetical protein Pmi06nite_75820 [Planotetraspora mira]